MGELIDGFRVMIDGSQEEKLKFMFDVADINGNGTIDSDELDIMFASSLKEANIDISDDVYERLIETFMSEADSDDDGMITYEELRDQFKAYPELLPNMTLNIPGLLPAQSKKQTQVGRRSMLNLFNAPINFISWCKNRNNRSNLILLSLFILVNVVIFGEAAYKWRSIGSNWFLVIARGHGATLNFNCSLIVVFVLREFLTYLRSCRFTKFFQIDENIDIHRHIGYIIAFQAVCHTVAHIGNAHHVVKNKNGDFTMLDLLLTNPHLTSLGHPWVAGTAFQSGWMLGLILLLMVLLSMNFVRRQGHFQVFYFSHLLYVVFWGFLLLHGPRFWKFFLLPASLFVYEKVMNLETIRTAFYGGKSYIKEARVLTSKVTHLKITRPPNFDYEPGDYVFIRIPALAKMEWHPFTISSAPEEKETFSLHIRSAGNWTNKLYKFIENQARINDDNVSVAVSGRRKTTVACPNMNNNNLQEEMTQGKPMSEKLQNELKLFEVSIEGPYGTPTRAIFRAEHAVLIGAGIGVTPFASILQSIINRYRLSKQCCPRCEHTWTGVLPPTLMELKKVNFIWINRDHKSFEWFAEMLAQMELEQGEEQGEFDKFFEMEMYMTKELHQNRMRSIALQMALQTLHKSTKKDLLTGLKTRLQSGRPNWDKVFKNIQAQKNGRVEVFFCGAPALSEILERYCAKYDFIYHKESF
ncbi:NADPH oxidase 5-like isoform X2 [Apostichopus japonicus]